MLSATITATFTALELTATRRSEGNDACDGHRGRKDEEMVAHSRSNTAAEY
jgi:hypothetical protein